MTNESDLHRSTWNIALSHWKILSEAGTEPHKQSSLSGIHSTWKCPTELDSPTSMAITIK